jgi:hypothetical protein
MPKHLANKILNVQGREIGLISRQFNDYISLTDIAGHRNEKETFAIINNWMRSRSTIDFLELWEKLSNPDFKPLEFERFKNEAGSNYFLLSPQRWIEATNAIGIFQNRGDTEALLRIKILLLNLPPGFHRNSNFISLLNFSG